MDPHAVLGVTPGATSDELTARYRRLAKRWHPDRARTPEAQRRMAEINTAYELLRSEQWQAVKRASGVPRGDAGAGVRVPRAGDWLPEAVRRALGPELLPVLQPREDVRLVLPVSAWASPQALLAVTDRRLLWLLDDAVAGRVRSLALAAITDVQVRLAWPRRRTASLRIARRNGRRPITFVGLRPETAHDVSRLIAGRAVAA